MVAPGGPHAWKECIVLAVPSLRFADSRRRSTLIGLLRWSPRLALAQAAGAAYVNYLSDDASADEVKGAYGGEKYRRLRSLKAKHDPQNVCRYNQNIPPA